MALRNFFGNLYHLNVSEEDEQRDYQNFAKAYSGSDDAYAKKFGARGVIHSYATGKSDPTVDPRFGPVGKQKITDTGPLSQERMKDFDGSEVVPKAIEFMKQAKVEDKPFFIWLNPTRMHLYTRLNEKWRYAAENITSEVDLHGSGMMQQDHDVGVVLQFLKDNGLSENTVVWYSTDNGPEHSSWPHGATTPFRGEKMTTWEGGVRVVSMGAVAPGHPGRTSPQWYSESPGYVHNVGGRGRCVGRREPGHEGEETAPRWGEQFALLDGRIEGIRSHA